MHILATSRKERDIEITLDPLINNDCKMPIQTAAVDQDIQAYVHEQLQTRLGLKKWQNKPEIAIEIETVLVQKAQGMQVFPKVTIVS